jgi:photosystem II stability/assembly factor-like uncharacterized protein
MSIRAGENGSMFVRRALLPIVRRSFESTLILVLIGLPEAPGSPTAHARSQPQHTLAQRSSAKVIDTPDPNVKWRITSGRFVERSLDRGATWNGQEVTTTGELLAGSAPNAKTCWVVGRDGLVYVTKDAQRWEEATPPVSADLVAVSAKNASSAIVTAADGRQFSTRDGGRKWELLNPSHP